MNTYYDGPRDPRPKRQKSLDNPYSIFSVGINTDFPRYFVEFVDGAGQFHQEEVSRELYELFDYTELRDVAHMYEVRNHYESVDEWNETLNCRAGISNCPVEDVILEQCERESVSKAVLSLSPSQFRRTILYYYKNMTAEQIAKTEGCTHQAVTQSLRLIAKKLKKFFV